ncbi:TetR/AcrR family transcriptional regulator [Streptomyces sp. SID11385]|uniref:TetR/AcrR family transcriptional regulator n=1 Tax=Streptomyces sp. SID11385 TaxID=2706031 RepID=UPI0013CC102D|nr:TetR/AcrR family transcriptional regulator [Streptomyces sp. SID11385]NEA39003.1 TetR/AcrR family transcriptional regulator [Streptomyces sp. SID11385]
MPRWKPDAQQRLVLSALRLFAERGYDDTTVAQIAEDAGLTRSTFHRHFSDKRDILAAGQETLSRLLAAGIAEAPADASPVTAVAGGLARASAGMTSFNRELSPLLRAAVEANKELQERQALKSVGMARAMADALAARGVPAASARVAAELGVLAFKIGYERWSAEASGTLDEHALAALRELHAAATRLD